MINQVNQIDNVFTKLTADITVGISFSPSQDTLIGQYQLDQPVGREQHVGQRQQQRRDDGRERALRLRRLQLGIRVLLVLLEGQRGLWRRRMGRRVGVGWQWRRQWGEKRQPEECHP